MNLTIAAIIAFFNRSASAQAAYALAKVQSRKDAIDDARTALTHAEKAALEAAKAELAALTKLVQPTQKALTDVYAEQALELTEFDKDTKKRVKALQDRILTLEAKRNAKRNKLTSAQRTDVQGVLDDKDNLDKALENLRAELAALEDLRTVNDALAESQE